MCISLDAFFLLKPHSWAESQQWIFFLFSCSVHRNTCFVTTKIKVLNKGYVQYYYIHQRHQLLKIKLRPFNYIFLTLSSGHFSQINFSAAQGSSLSMKQPTGIFVWLNVFPQGLGNVRISCCQIVSASQLAQGHGLLLGRGRCSSEPTKLGMRWLRVAWKTLLPPKSLHGPNTVPSVVIYLSTVETTGFPCRPVSGHSEDSCKMQGCFFKQA